MSPLAYRITASPRHDGKCPLPELSSSHVSDQARSYRSKRCYGVPTKAIFQVVVARFSLNASYSVEDVAATTRPRDRGAGYTPRMGAPAHLDQSRLLLNIEFLITHSSRGRIVLFSDGTAPRGYSILIPYWSNELGAPFSLWMNCSLLPRRAQPRYRQKYLQIPRRDAAVALALEVSPGNKGAQRPCGSLGFSRRQDSVLTYRFADNDQNIGT